MRQLNIGALDNARGSFLIVSNPNQSARNNNEEKGEPREREISSLGLAYEFIRPRKFLFLWMLGIIIGGFLMDKGCVDINRGARAAGNNWFACGVALWFITLATLFFWRGFGGIFGV
ncbi:MAG: hypothetical protein WCA63_09130 [Gallionella sp.]